MAIRKSKESEHIGLPNDTLVDVVAINGSQVVIKEMTYGESLIKKKAKGWKYTTYQKGFHGFKATN